MRSLRLILLVVLHTHDSRSIKAGILRLKKSTRVVIEPQNMQDDETT